MEGLSEDLRIAAQGLHRSILAYGLRPEHTQAIAALAHRVSFSAGEHLYMADAKDADLFVILEGHVDLLTNDGDKLSEVGPGGVLGEISFVDAGPRHAFAVATGFVVALRFPAHDLRVHLCQNPTIGFLVLTNLARLLASRLRSADGRLDHLMDHEHDCWRHSG